jgi:hypothetical protein
VVESDGFQTENEDGKVIPTCEKRKSGACCLGGALTVRNSMVVCKFKGVCNEEERCVPQPQMPK